MKTGFLLFSLLGMSGPVWADTLTFAVSTGSAMPMTQFHGEMLSSGLLKDFGDALALELKLEPRYLNLPRKRVEAALLDGQADLLCDLRPEWLDRKGWLWTGTVFSNNMIVVSRIDTATLPALSGLSGQRVGTLLGYRYPEMEQALGRSFARDDAASDDLNTSKLLGKRFNYMVSNSLYFDYQRMVHPQSAQLNPAVLTVRSFDTFCALPPRGKLQLDRVNRAIIALRQRGTMRAIYERYRPSR
ncbi:amino acid ABC transporter substrate-binding protein, PAAT family [Massilia sp. CF038]|nr:amino acid ABC transporter substrate-binding protein, PAAT family [Massilia sp. CF038]